MLFCQCTKFKFFIQKRIIVSCKYIYFYIYDLNIFIINHLCDSNEKKGNILTISLVLSSKQKFSVISWAMFI
ncbi:hypothetical protein L1987_83092 [Smallanthus sonchifolius]|uniref:Uncharacterized protein n=1 Tax=Smallanthus sonchifolius TaxID=185202 RepID=A0ACB8YC69_9ASTR|nr:hypothetical protein L1987_83092 [Smallanthus sonchifolius]